MSWLTDWDQASEHPVRTRMFFFVSFSALTVWLSLLSGFLSDHWLGTLAIAPLIGLIGTVLVEPMTAGRRKPRRTRSLRSVVSTFGVVTALFLSALVLAILTDSAFPGGILIALGVIAFAVRSRSV